MIGDISADDFAIGHFLIAQRYGVETQLHKSSTLHFLSKQLLTSLRKKSASYKGAFVAYWIAKQRPFDKLNTETAAILGSVVAGHGEDPKVSRSLSKMLSGEGISIAKLQACLEA